MIKSMTAYGRITRNSPIGRWVVEIHSVNRKTLDFAIHVPKDFLQFDIEIRKWLSHSVKRGQVTVKVNVSCDSSSSELIDLHLNQLKSFKSCMENAAKELGYPTHEISFSFLMEQVQNLSGSVNFYEKEDLVRQELQTSIEQALMPFLKMRECEGESLAQELKKHLEILQNYLQTIEGRIGMAEDKYRNKILNRLEGFGLNSPEDKERVIREVVLYAEKIDVSEEIARLKSHIQQFFSLLNSEEASVGRTMDFLIQEMGREINTLAAKADDMEISFAALKMKSEMEKIREQAQNIE